MTDLKAYLYEMFYEFPAENSIDKRPIRVQRITVILLLHEKNIVVTRGVNVITVHEGSIKRVEYVRLLTAFRAPAEKFGELVFGGENKGKPDGLEGSVPAKRVSTSRFITAYSPAGLQAADSSNSSALSP